MDGKPKEQLGRVFLRGIFKHANPSTNQSRRVKNINIYTCTLKYSKIIERKTKNVQTTKPKRKFFIEKNNFYVHIKTNVVTNTPTIWTLRVSILTYFFAMNSKQKKSN